MHKLALIGAGRIGRIHAANIAAHPELQLAYVIDPVDASAKEVAASYGAKTSDLNGALRDASITGVIVASSTDTHLDFRIVIDVANLANDARVVTATTLVKRHNLLGRVYLAVVMPFHKRIVPAMLNRLAIADARI